MGLPINRETLTCQAVLMANRQAETINGTDFALVLCPSGHADIMHAVSLSGDILTCKWIHRARGRNGP